MPTIVRNTIAANELLEHAISTAEAKQFREDGLHISDALYCAARGWDRIVAGVSSRQTTAENPRLAAKLFAGVGHGAFLQVEDGAETKVLLDLGDGVVYHGTIDLTQPVPVGEIKTTRSSAKKPIIQSNTYIEQVASYCLAKQTRRARLYVLYLMGKYGNDMDPIFEAFDVEFTEAELVAWAKELKRRYFLMTGPKRPNPDFEHFGYECDGCKRHPSVGGNCPVTKNKVRKGFFAEADEGIFANEQEGE